MIGGTSWLVLPGSSLGGVCFRKTASSLSLGGGLGDSSYRWVLDTGVVPFADRITIDDSALSRHTSSLFPPCCLGINPLLEPQFDIIP